MIYVRILPDSDDMRSVEQQEQSLRDSCERHGYAMVTE